MKTSHVPLSKEESEIAAWRFEHRMTWAKWHDEAMKKLADAGATGVIMSPYETNLALAKRDYTQRCETKHEGEGPQGSLIMVEGYWIWWCKIHHQPMPWCDEGKTERLLKKVLEKVMSKGDRHDMFAFISQLLLEKHEERRLGELVNL